jgi:hypothetical protein
MIDELADLLPYFRGSTNRVRCFLHILNLVARKILMQFDLPKKKPGHLETDLDQLAGDIDEEEPETRRELGGGEDNDNDVGACQGKPLTTLSQLPFIDEASSCGKLRMQSRTPQLESCPVGGRFFRRFTLMQR